MTITLTLGTWMVPLIITLLSIICYFSVSHFEDERNWGAFSFMAFFGGIIATIISWVIWLIMTLMAK